MMHYLLYSAITLAVVVVVAAWAIRKAKVASKDVKQIKNQWNKKAK